MKRVGIVGWWFAINYGSVITYYALYKAIEKLGYTPSLIDCNAERKAKTTNIARDFMARNSVAISESYPLRELSKLNNHYDVFVVGSDQVWRSRTEKNIGYFFYLDFVDNSKTQLAYAPSYGVDNYKSDEKTINHIKSLLNRFDRISVREESGVKVHQDTFGGRPERVLDPVFLIDRADYDEIAVQSKIKNSNSYIASYILDPTEDKRELLLYASKKLNLPLKNVLDPRKERFNENMKTLNLTGSLENVNVEDWVNHFKHASYVITDSHHGLAMAMIYNKQVIAYGNKQRGITRFESLLKIFKMEDRMVFSAQDVIDKQLLSHDIDYEFVNRKLAEEKSRCLNWLAEGLNIRKAQHRAVTSKLDINMCTGCGACINICPTKALSFGQDKWGFYRSYIDSVKCINCGKCSQVCPALNLPFNTNSVEPTCIAAIASSEDILLKSSSGGVFSLLAERVLDDNGVIVGAAWGDGKHIVKHMQIDTKEDLGLLRKSKYLQSYIGDTPTQIKKLLDQGKKVLFTGCPCQVAGIRGMLGKKDYPNFIAVDILCGNAPSSAFFEKYLRESFPDGIQKYEFRYKTTAWDYYGCGQILVTDSTGVQHMRRGRKQDDYQAVFHDHTMCPAHCENCRYQALPRFGDITIGDFWGVGNKDKSFNTRKGVSAVLINNEKGKRFFDSIKDEYFSLRKEVPLAWLGGNGFAINGAHNKCSEYRDDFFNYITKMPFSKAVDEATNRKGEIERKIYKGTRTLLQLDSWQDHFEFDGNLWEVRKRSNGRYIIKTKKSDMGKGHFCAVSLGKKLETKKFYLLSARFRLRSESNKFDFFIFNATTGANFAVITKNCGEINDGIDWIEISEKFTPDKGGYQQIAFSGSQLAGLNAFLEIDYLHVIDLSSAVATTIESDLIKKQEDKIKTQENKIKKIENELQAIKNSKAYSVGETLAWPVRTIRKVLKNIKHDI